MSAGADESSPFKLYYLATAVAPGASPSFEGVTGPKTDDWLVHMVGLLAMVERGFSWRGCRSRSHRAPEAMVLAIGRHWPSAG